MSQQLVQIKDEQNSIQMITHLAKSFGYGRKGSKNLNILLSSLRHLHNYLEHLWKLFDILG